METQSPPRYKIFHNLLQELADLVEKLEKDIMQRLNSSDKGPKGPLGGIRAQAQGRTGQQSLLSKLGGIRGLGKWVWTGRAENFINNFNKMTLKEYADSENEINLICEEIINKNLNLNEDYNLVADIVNKFKKDVVEVARKYAKQVEEEQARESRAISELQRQLRIQQGAPEDMPEEEIEQAYNARGEEEREDKENKEDEGDVEQIKRNTKLNAILIGMRDIKEDKSAKVDDEPAFDFIIEMLKNYNKLSPEEKDEFLKDLQEESKNHPYHRMLLIIIENNFVNQVLTKLLPNIPIGSSEI